MSTATLLPPWKIDEPPPTPVRRFTVEEYRQIAECEILTEDDRVELIEGACEIPFCTGIKTLEPKKVHFFGE